MASQRQTPWERFKANPNPLSKPREIWEALPDGPGLNSLYNEIKSNGTVLGVAVLSVGRNVFVPRAKVIERVEGVR